MLFLPVLAGVIVAIVLMVQLVDYLYPWLKNDLRIAIAFIRLGLEIRRCSKCKPVYTAVDEMEERARNNPDKTFIYFEDDVWTFQRMNQLSNKVARLMHDSGIRANDTVALMMTNRPEFVGIWYGIAKTGAATALINHNIRGKSLRHCIEVSGCRILVISNDEDLAEAVRDIQEDLVKKDITIYVLGEVSGTSALKHSALQPLLDERSDENTPSEWRNELTMDSHFCYVYTSGTTGLPKPAAVSHLKAHMPPGLLRLSGTTESDIIYSPLPLYHTSSGLAGILGALKIGCSIVLRRKFSASGFWPDCRRYKATIIQYIGETMRYICDQPPNKNDKNHCVRVALGNGMRPAVWKKLLERYGQQIKVFEFYGATEANFGTLNLDHHIGSIGTLTPFTKLIGIFNIIKYDQEKDEVYRNSNGRCVPAADGEPGLAIGRITKNTQFIGYRGDKKNTERKILHNVFSEGDAFFNSGDVLRKDSDYHVYFIDRVGDTFRWKGENVSTNEVADVMSEAPGVKETNVYGVEIPGKEGRAGMMVVLLRDGTTLDCEGVYKHACQCLATYARPVFIRIKEEIDLTGSFKHKKVQLMKEGFWPSSVGDDPVFFLDKKNKRYSVLNQDAINQILEDKIRV